ncbi:NAD(P)-binding protein [Massarina eburnea CBS 473.64]|uniref:NAD(P)-binding protein n=1 Tax=Massarina eburnea CBS 473.64 TaxID=1395130 RepID=A0A6A6S3Z3_9PLEO|nr:NAD(P)-binding protein [Massarina eburnea CBS 473.64]
MSQDPGQKYLNSGANFTETIHHDTFPAIDPLRTNLNGKTVLITGASKGLGKATAISYAKAGASGIILGARSPLEGTVDEVKAAAKEAGRPEPKILSLNLDVTDRANVDEAARAVTEAFDGRIDILINNAGYLSAFKPLTETDPEEWWKDYNVNLKGVYLMTRAFLPLLLRSSHKVIINISSISANILPPNSSAYSSSKLALLRFNEFIDQDHGPRTKDGIVVIGLHPGGVQTELAFGMSEDFWGVLIDTPELAADWMVWVGKERREWLGGRYVSVTWDTEELEGKKEEVLKGDLLKVRMAVNLFPGA